jgi:hypothetical protein
MNDSTKVIRSLVMNTSAPGMLNCYYPLHCIFMKGATQKQNDFEEISESAVLPFLFNPPP